MNHNTPVKILLGVLFAYIGFSGAVTATSTELLTITIMIGIPELMGGLWLLSDGVSEYGVSKGWFKNDAG